MKSKIVKSNIVSCVIACILAVITCSFVYLHSLQKTMDEQAYSQTMLLVHILEKSRESPVSLLSSIKADISGRITFVGTDGKVIFDSDYEEQAMESHADRSEIVAASKDGMGTAKRYSSTARGTTYYCAAKVEGMGVVRIGIMASKIAGNVLLQVSPMIFFCLVMIICICYWLSSQITEKIVDEIESYDIENGEGQIYDELSHFITKINRQNKIITSQIHSITQEKTKLQNIFLNIKEGIIVCDENKNIIQSNSEAQEIFSFPPEEGNFLSCVRVPDLQKSLQCAIDGQSVHLTIEYNSRYYQCALSPSTQGEEKGAILIVLDITQQLENEHRRRRFTDNVTHELKTPLTSIVGYSQLITNNLAKPEDVNGFVKIIETNALRLLEMIEDIIKISDLEDGSGIEKIPLNFEEVVLRTVNEEQVSAASRNVLINTKVEKVRIIADESQMYQLMHNLISNAVKYNTIGGTVSVSLQKQGRYALLNVSDTGIGIPNEDLDKIFERFYVVDKSRNKNISSSGLGLAIVKHIVKAHGGVITVKSAKGKGSQFSVKLPLE
ncbi:MAG: ATP-binding protein [Oscillospiraceae bacterium]